MDVTNVIGKELCRELYKLPEDHALPYYESIVNFVTRTIEFSGYEIKEWIDACTFCYMFKWPSWPKLYAPH